MTQPENNSKINTVNFISDGTWIIDFDHLRSDVPPPIATEDIPIINVGNVKWYQYSSNMPIETELEKNEKNVAIGEQIRIGILKVSPDGKSISVNDNTLQSSITNIKTFEMTPAKIPPKPTHKIGPNEQCPCGSGRKFKKCCQHKKYLR